MSEVAQAREQLVLLEGAAEPATVTATSACIDPKRASDALRLLGTSLAPAVLSLTHLKRIRKGSDGNLRILLCPTAYAATEDGKGAVDDAIAQLGLTNVRDTDIPARPATSPEEWQEFSQLWPLNQPQPRISLAAVQSLSDSDIQLYADAMKAAMQQARIAFEQGYAPVGAVVVLTGSESKMIAMEHCRVPPKAVSCPYFSVNGDAASCPTSMVFHPLDHAVMRAIEVVAAQARDPADKKETGKKRKSVVDSYLCTGMDIVTTHAPCLMCAFALVHSRIRRLIYALDIPTFEGIGSSPTCRKLHTLGGINHKFDAYAGLMRDSVSDLMTSLS